MFAAYDALSRWRADIVSRLQRTLRKTLDVIAHNNEATTLDMMRAAEQLSDQILRQKLLNSIHQLNQDAQTLKQLARDDVLLQVR